MRKINRKFIITFLGVLLLSIICFSGITMMFADERNGAGDFATSTDASFGNSVQSNISGAATPTTTPASIIDWIIDFSNSTDAAIDKEYHIVEIYSGSNPSALSTMVDSDGKFEKLVLDGHKSEGFTPDFKPGNIDYQSFSNKVAAGSTAETNLINAIEKADLVYLSEDPDELWDTDNDITEQLIQTLTKFAVTDGKPFIVDSHNLTMQIKLQSKKLIKDLVGNYYVKEGSKYNTFAFDQTKDIEAVMNTANVTANYKSLDGDIPQSSTDPNYGWNKVTYTEVKAEDDPNTDDVNEADSEDHTDYIARVLTIYNSSVTTNLTITNKILDCCSGDYSFTFTDNDSSATQPKDKTVAAKGTFTPDGTVKVLDEGSDFYKYAYYGRNARPQALKFEAMDLSNTTDLTALETIDFTQYDFVIFEEETKDVDISGKDDLFNSLVGAMTNGVHVLYDSKIAPTGSSYGTISELDADGIKQLYSKVASTNDQPKYDSVLVTARQKMNDIYAASTSAEGVKDIANIINAGAFRSIGHGSSDSSNKYTVLEIEPCYPIDTVLAQHLKNARNWNNSYGITFLKASARTNAYSQYSDSFYYLRTDGVSSKTPDEISYGTSASLTSLLENTADLDALITQDNIANVTDYYKWHISKAKIAHATGKSMDEINVVHMSSSEFAASRKTLLDNYDAIYIGGDNSAIKPGDNWYTKGKGNYYNMYFHNGDLYNYSDDQNNKWGGQYGVIGGNDLTYDKMEELKAYAKKMPVILDRTVCDAYVNASLQDNNQHVMDPDSNMYNFINSVTEIKDSALESKYTSTVLINFDSDYTYKAVNNSDKYGTTYGGYATVFLGNNAPTDAFRTATVNNNKVGEDKLKTVLEANERPRFVITVSPRTYSDLPKKNNTTWIDPDEIKNEGLVWKVELNNKATVKLYIDDDSDGKFKEEELVAKKEGKNVTLNFKPNPDYYGVVYWKLVANVGDLSASKTGCCKIKRTTQSKMYVNLLQIMPVAGKDKFSTSETKEVSLRTLFFCTECQFAKDILRSTAFVSTGIFTKGVMGGENTVGGGSPSFVPGVNDIKKVLNKIDSSYKYNGSNLGSHTHDFGLVEYQSDLTLGDVQGADNIESNLFDIIRDDYDVDETIMFTDDFQKKIGDTNKLYNGLNSKGIKDKKKGYEEKYNKYNRYYLGMKAVLNGKVEGTSNTYVSVSGTNATVDVAKLNADFSYAGKTFTEFMSEVGVTEDMLNAYASASYKLDDMLLNRADEFKAEYPDIKLHKDKIIANLTDEDIPRDMRKYHHLMALTGDTNALGTKIPTDYVTYYVNYRDAKIIENCLFDLYQENLWNSSYDEESKTVDLDNIYDCIAIGAADHFGGANNAYSDLNDTACDSLEKYIKDDGNLILFHDTLNADKGATTTMTKRLSSLFGMNARHMTVGTKKVASSKEIEVTVDGTKLTNKVTLPATTQKRVMEIQQTGEDITANDNSVVVKVGSAEKNISGLTNADKGYEITVEKSSVEVGVIKLYLSESENENKNGSPKVINIPANAASVTIEYDWDYYGHWPKSPEIKNITYTNSTAAHNIQINMSGTARLVVGLNSKDNFVRGDSNKAPNNGSFTISSSNTSTEKETVTIYDFTSVSKMTGTLTGRGTQQINVMVVDNTSAHNPISGETVEYTVNGNDGSVVTDAAGVATFYRENYRVTGYTVNSDTTENVDTTAHPDGFVDDQTLEITVKDVNGNIMPGKSVQANVSATDSQTYNTGTDGKVSFVYKNYDEVVDTSARTYTLDSDYTSQGNKYKMSNISGTNNSTISLSPWMLSMKGVYEKFGVGNFGNANQYIMYKYVEMSSQMDEEGLNNTRIGSKHMMNLITKGDNSPAYPTDKCERNNEGIITMYPFTIPPQIHVGATAPGSYALDIEDDNLVVYYSMVGGTEGTGSSLFAADPMDGQNNYFLYQYGSITYTGAGHGLLTGFGRENNDERKLFINCIVNAGKKSSRGPSLTLHDLDSTLDEVDKNVANKTIKECNYEDCDYYTEIEEVADFKGFDFLPHIPTGNKLKNVQVYYDVNHTDDYADDGAYSCDADDVEIFKWNNTDGSEDSAVVSENILTAMKQATTNNKIVLMEDRFDPKKNRDYAYIVVDIEDTNGQKASATLRIQYKQSLIDLN